MNPTLYDELYYKSNNYVDYVNRSDRYATLVNEVHNLLRSLGLNNDPILDFGCAVGFVSEALLNLEYTVDSVEISEWALEQCRKKNLNVSNKPNYDKQYGVVFALDVLEHMEEDELNTFVDNIKTKAMVVRVPICLNEGEDYYLDVAKNDKTHIIKWTFEQWNKFFRDKGYFTLNLKLSTIYSSLGGYCALCVK
jgi:hypothetical protein